MTPIRIRQLTSQALGEATYVSSRTTPARHRAQTVRTNPLNTLSKAVSSNAGTVGRQAAVLAAASGLVLTVGLPAQATDTDVSKSEASSTQQLVATAVITAEPTATVSFESPPPWPPWKPPQGSTARSAGYRARSSHQRRNSGSSYSKVFRGQGFGLQCSCLRSRRNCLHRHRLSLRLGRNHTQRLGLLRLHPVGLRTGRNQHPPRVNAWTAMTPTSTPAPGDLVMQNGGAT